MHGLIFRSFQNFVSLTYGAEVWLRVASNANLPSADFEAMLNYDASLVPGLLRAASKELDKPSSTLLEDMGTFLVTHPRMEPMRRLLRFGGSSYDEFLHSLEDLPGRVRLAVSDVQMPRLVLSDRGANGYDLCCTSPYPFFGLVLVGMLRALADDYGALALVEHRGRIKHDDLIDVTLLEADFAQARRFDLAAGLRDRRAGAE
ncbi:MAG: heme NO-binding domain-containing protein [Roseivivax sp.]|nr:heme NO-binding domain-containing protein [Roseivivax sp.]